MNEVNGYSKRVQHGWAMYDWANSVYTLVVGTAIFPIYYAAVMDANGQSVIQFFGMELDSTAAYTFMMAAAYLLVSVVTPYLSALSEVGGSKKHFMRGFIWAGSLTTASMYFFTADHMLLGLWTPFLGAIAFSGSLVFYNSYLPEIAAKPDQDALSAKGFSLGYFGSVLVLIGALVCIQKPSWFGLDSAGLIIRVVFLVVAAWWLLWGEYSLARLPHNHGLEAKEKGWIVSAYVQLIDVAKSFSSTVGLQRFVIGFFFASAGVQTVILIASLFGTEVLHLETGALITTIILIQFVGIIGAQLFAYLSGRIGNMRALLVAAALWAVICFLAFLVQTEMQFYLLGSSLGLVLGGIQALARSTFAKMLPDGGEHVTYFSFFDIAEKLATVMGMLGVGWIIETTGDMRISALLLSVFFVIAVVVWFPIQFRQSKQIRER